MTKPEHATSAQSKQLVETVCFSAEGHVIRVDVGEISVKSLRVLRKRKGSILVLWFHLPRPTRTRVYCSAVSC